MSPILVQLFSLILALLNLRIRNVLSQLFIVKCFTKSFLLDLNLRVHLFNACFTLHENMHHMSLSLAHR